MLDGEQLCARSAPLFSRGRTHVLLSIGFQRALVEQLRAQLAGGGVLAFTFVDPYFLPPEGWARQDETPGLDNLRWRLTVSRGPAEAATIATAARRSPLTWATLVNHETLVNEASSDWIGKGDERSQYFAFCTEQHMRSLYPDAEIRPPVRPQRHSCCIFRSRPAQTST